MKQKIFKINDVIHHIYIKINQENKPEIAKSSSENLSCKK